MGAQDSDYCFSIYRLDKDKVSLLGEKVLPEKV